jgi:hypothetical protein
MAKIKSNHTPQESQTQKVLRQALQLTDPERDELLCSLIFSEPAPHGPKLHVGHLFEAEVFGICSEFPKLSRSAIEKRVLADPAEGRLYQMFSKVVQDNLADVL